MKKEELPEPCPFCGGVGRGVEIMDIFHNDEPIATQAICIKCGACGPRKKNEYYAIRAWNKAPRFKHPREISRERRK